ncbi:MAG: phenylacetic acid degradation protein, partial [Alphaproteobacteria bacterium]
MPGAAAGSGTRAAGAADALGPVIEALHAGGPLRVWSLVITVFGDAVEPRGGRIASARLAALLGRLGVSAGAMRTALSRLAADGWVARDREGRNTFYRLGPRGSREFGPAGALIYAPPEEGPARRWRLWLPLPGGQAPALGAHQRPVALPGGALIWPERRAPAQGPGEGLVLEGALVQVPAALRAALADPAQRAALERLRGAFAGLDPGALGPLEAMAARTALIHMWRRIVLRWPELPAELAPADWPGLG